MNEWPLVSILIASKDRRKDLTNAIKSIQNLDYPKDRFEIVVIEETDDPQNLPGVQYFAIPRKNLGFGYARNQCIKHARYPLLVFTDDDCEMDPLWLKELTKPLFLGAIGVAGAVKVKENNKIGFCESILGFPGGGLRQIWKSQNKIIPIKQLSTCNCLYQKQVLLKEGGFKENTEFSGEDYDLAQRVVRKYSCYYNPKAIVYHRPRGSFIANLKWFIRRGRSEVNLILLRTHSLGRQLFFLIYASLSLRIIVAIILFLLLKIPVWFGLTGLALLYYCITLWRNYFQFKMEGTLKTWLMIPLVKFIMDLGWDVGKCLQAFSLIKQKLSKIKQKEKNA